MYVYDNISYKTHFSICLWTLRKRTQKQNLCWISEEFRNKIGKGASVNIIGII